MMDVCLLEYQWLIKASASASTRRRKKGRQVIIPDMLFEALRSFDEQRALARGGDFTRTVLDWQDMSAQSRQWVGVMHIPGLRLEILPKIGADTDAQSADERARGALMGMLHYAEGAKVRPQGSAQLDEDISPMSELFFAQFARELIEELRLGVLRGYVTHEERIQMPRGRLLMTRQITRGRGAVVPLWCTFDEFEQDTPLNRALLAACHLLSRRTHLKRTRQLLRECAAQLSGVTHVQPTSRLIDELTWTRQTRRFERLASFCRLIFEDINPSLHAGEQESYALVFDMNQVYEQFVEQFISQEVMDEEMRAHGVTFKPQGGGKAAYLLRRCVAGQKRRLHLKPDLLFCCGEASFVIDTKWKSLKRRGDPVSRADLYQLYTYLDFYKAQRVMLLYPEVDTASEHGGYEVIAKPGHYIEVDTINVGVDPRVKEVRDALVNKLEGFILRGLSVQIIEPDHEESA